MASKNTERLKTQFPALKDLTEDDVLTVFSRSTKETYKSPGIWANILTTFAFYYILLINLGYFLDAMGTAGGLLAYGLLGIGSFYSLIAHKESLLSANIAKAVNEQSTNEA